MAKMNTNLTTTNLHAAWAGEPFEEHNLVPGGSRLIATEFHNDTAVKVTLTAPASASAVSLAVSALSGTIPAGTTLYFGETGELARVATAPAAGATAITVDAIPAAIESGDVAYYEGTGKAYCASGTLVGRTYTERDAGTGFGLIDPAAASVTDDEVFLVAFDVYDVAGNPEVALYRHQRIVKETFLPIWATASAAVKTALRARYQVTTGAA